jgi:Arc/MetJ family transcription regulator
MEIPDARWKEIPLCGSKTIGGARYIWLLGQPIYRSLTITVVDIFNNGARAMATVNFSVPDEVKAAFDKAFSGQNKSAVVAELMRRAVRESVQRARREQLFRQLSNARGSRGSVSALEVSAARTAGRP